MFFSMPKRHHYVPVTYLKNFCDGSGQLQVFRKDDPARPFRQRPESTGFERYYYSQFDDEGIPVVAMQNELSLASPERQNEPAILDQAGAMFMAYAPLGRGLLTGRSGNVSVPGDLRERMPQFQDDAKKANLERLAVVDEIAAKHATSRVGVALAWTLHAGSNVVPIPGARSPEQVRTAIMAADLALTSDEMLRLSASAQQIVP